MVYKERTSQNLWSIIVIIVGSSKSDETSTVVRGFIILHVAVSSAHKLKNNGFYDPVYFQYVQKIITPVHIILRTFLVLSLSCLCRNQLRNGNRAAESLLTREIIHLLRLSTN